MRPKNPAEYEVDVSGADVNIGDVVLVWSSDGSISGIDYSQVIDHKGYDSGYLKVFLVESSGTVSISTSATADVIHTGDQSVVGITNYVEYIIQEWESEQTFGQFSDHVDEEHSDYDDHDDYGSGTSHGDEPTEHSDRESTHDDHKDGFTSHIDHNNYYDHDDTSIHGEFEDEWHADEYEYGDQDEADYEDSGLPHGDHTDHEDHDPHDDWNDHADGGEGVERTGHGDAPIEGLKVGDLIIEWDEGDIGGKDWETDSDYMHLYTQTSSGISRGVWQPTNTSTVERTISCCQEHDALHLELLGVPSATNLQAVPTRDIEIDLDWEASLNPHHFYIYRKRKGKRFNTAYRVDGSLRQFNDEDISSGVEYTYKVQGAKPIYSETTFGKDYYEVGIGDLLISYGEASVSGVSYDKIVNDIGINKERLEVYVVYEEGQVSISSTGETEVVHRGRVGTTEVTDTRVRISSGDGSLTTFADNLTDGDIIIQWSSSDAGDDSGYMNFTGDARVLYSEEGEDIDRKVYQVFSEGDVERIDNGVELAAIDIDLSPINRLNDMYGQSSNEATVMATYPYIAIR